MTLGLACSVIHYWGAYSVNTTDCAPLRLNNTHMRRDRLLAFLAAVVEVVSRNKAALQALARAVLEDLDPAGY